MFRFSERKIHTTDFRGDFLGALRSAVLTLASRANPARRSARTESIQRRRIIDEDAVADSLLGRPVVAGRNSRHQLAQFRLDPLRRRRKGEYITIP